MAVPREKGFFMPAEWTEHERCWMAWPCREESWGDGLDAARTAFADVAMTIAEFEPVTMVANSEEVADVSLRCKGVVCQPMDHDDSWTRDSGPTFLLDSNGRRAGVSWRFNAWGEKYSPYDKDAALAAAILEKTNSPCFEAPIVLEGGAIHVDGDGTLITTEQCLLNANRNPGVDRGQMERVLCDFLGVEKVIWLYGDPRDEETDGHVDNLACFVKPGVVLAMVSDDESDPSHEAFKRNVAILREATDARGRALEVIEMPAPKGRAKSKLLESYVNFYIANQAIIAPAFEDSRDEHAYEVMKDCFPKHQIVQVSARDIVVGGGGIHCITQQQPRAR